MRNAQVALPRMTQPTEWWLQLIGRLTPGATLQQAHANFARASVRRGLLADLDDLGGLALTGIVSGLHGYRKSF